MEDNKEIKTNEVSVDYGKVIDEKLSNYIKVEDANKMVNEALSKYIDSQLEIKQEPKPVEEKNPDLEEVWILE